MPKKQSTDGLTRSLERLAALHGLTHADGSINYNAFASRVGLPAPTIMRWHKGRTKDVSKKALQSICRALNVSEAQVRGIEPLPGLRRQYNPDARDVELIVQLRSLPVRKQKDIEKFVDMRMRMLTV